MSLTGVVYDGRPVCMAVGKACEQCALVTGTFLDPDANGNSNHVVVCVLCGHLASSGGQATCNVCRRTVCRNKSCWETTSQRCDACVELTLTERNTGTLMSLMELHARTTNDPPTKMIYEKGHVTVDGVTVKFPEDLLVDRFFTPTRDGKHRFSYTPAGSYGMVLFGKLGDKTPVAIKVSLHAKRLKKQRTAYEMETQPWFEPQIMCALGLHDDQQRFGLNEHPNTLNVPTTRVVASGPATSSIWWLHRQFVTVLRPRFYFDASQATDVRNQLEGFYAALWSEQALLRATGCTHGDLHRPNLAILEDGRTLLIDFGRAAPADPTVATPAVFKFFVDGSRMDWNAIGPYWEERMRKVTRKLWPDGAKFPLAVSVTHTLFMILSSFLTDKLLQSYNWEPLGRVLRPLPEYVNRTRVQNYEQLHELLVIYPTVLEAAIEVVNELRTPLMPPLMPPPPPDTSQPMDTRDDTPRRPDSLQNSVQITPARSGPIEEMMSDFADAWNATGSNDTADGIVSDVADAIFNGTATRVTDRVERREYARGRPDHPFKPRVEWYVRLRAPPPPLATLHFIG